MLYYELLLKRSIFSIYFRAWMETARPIMWLFIDWAHCHCKRGFMDFRSIFRLCLLLMDVSIPHLPSPWQRAPHQCHRHWTWAQWKHVQTPTAPEHDSHPPTWSRSRPGISANALQQTLGCLPHLAYKGTETRRLNTRQRANHPPCLHIMWDQLVTFTHLPVCSLFQDDRAHVESH